MRNKRRERISISSYFLSACSGLIIDSIVLLGLTSMGAPISKSQILSGTIGALVLYFLESAAIKNKYKYVWAWIGYQAVWIFCQSRIILEIYQQTNEILVAKAIVAGISCAAGFIVLNLISIISRGPKR